MDLRTLWTITGLAAVDMVNPCTLAVQVLLLSALVLTKGRRDAILGGILFTATIYIMYLLYGMGLLRPKNAQIRGKSVDGHSRSSGPYLSAIIYLANTTVEKIFYLLYYNVIFVLPMIGITLIVGLGTKPEAVMRWRNEHVRELHLVAGVLLLTVFFMV